jgi:hypothetical protein
MPDAPAVMATNGLGDHVGTTRVLHTILPAYVDGAISDKKERIELSKLKKTLIATREM